jgi:hypothetical protein
MRWFMKKEIKEKYLGIIKSDGKKGILFGVFFTQRRKGKIKTQGKSFGSLRLCVEIIIDEPSSLFVLNKLQALSTAAS